MYTTHAEHYQTKAASRVVIISITYRGESNNMLGERLKVALTDKQLADAQLQG